MLQTGTSGSMRWFVVGLSVHALAAGLLLANVLSSGGEHRVDARSQTATTLERNELELRVQSATEALAVRLGAPGFEDSGWKSEVESRAQELGLEAVPTLRALQEDDSRSPEQRVAARELVDELTR